MIVTYLVAVDIPDISQLLPVAEDILSDLQDAGHEVSSVHPWARPNMPLAQPAGGFTSLAAPPDPNLAP